MAMYFALLIAVHGKRIRFRDAVFALAFVVLSLSARRHVQWFYVLVLPIMAPYVAMTHIDAARARDILSKVPLLRRLPVLAGTEDGAETALSEADGSVEIERPVESVDPQAGQSKRSRVPELILIGALTITAVYFGGRASRTPVDPERGYPRDLIAYIKVNKITHIMNIWHEGGYLIYKGIQPMIDGRGDPFAPQFPGDIDFARQYLSAFVMDTDPVEFMKASGAEYLLIRKSPILLAMLRDPSMRIVRLGGAHALFRYTPATAPSPSSTTTVNTDAPGIALPEGLKQSGTPTGTTDPQTPSP
jgi:hypothetical protein